MHALNKTPKYMKQNYKIQGTSKHFNNNSWRLKQPAFNNGEKNQIEDTKNYKI